MIVRPLLIVLAACSGAAAAPVKNVAEHHGVHMLAVLADDKTLTIVRIDNSVHEIATFPEVTAFGWSDPRTLYALSADGIDGPTVVLKKIVDGKVVATRTLGTDDWPRFGSRLVLTKGGSVHVSQCEEASCTYLQLFPTRGAPTPKAPPDMIADAAQQQDWYDDANPWPLPSSVPAPPGVVLSTTSAVEHKEGWIEGEGSVTCKRGGVAVEWPNEASTLEPQILLRSKLRWISTTPPIYEVAAVTEGPKEWPLRRYYFRPCEQRPLDGYVWMSDGTWGSYDGEHGDGTWTFWRGTTPIGTLTGTPAIRPNR